MILDVVDYISSAGFIGWPIIALSIVLWSVLGYRWSLLKLPKSFSPERIENYRPDGVPSTLFEVMYDDAKRLALVDGTRKSFEVEMQSYQYEVNRGAKVVGSIVAVAPLMGLLGTVAGMIVTFKSMESMALFSQGGGIAGGISQALITTQMGLAVAIPGVLIGKFLNSRQQTFLQVIDHYRVQLEKRLDTKGESSEV